PIEPFQQFKIGRITVLFEVIEHQVGCLASMFQIDRIGRPGIVFSSLAAVAEDVGVATITAAGLSRSVTGLVAASRRRRTGIGIGLRLTLTRTFPRRGTRFRGTALTRRLRGGAIGRLAVLLSAATLARPVGWWRGVGRLVAVLIRLRRGTILSGRILGPGRRTLAGIALFRRPILASGSVGSCVVSGRIGALTVGRTFGVGFASIARCWLASIGRRLTGRPLVAWRRRLVRRRL